MDFGYYEYQKDHLDVNLDFLGQEACPPGYSFGPSVRANFVIHYIVAGKGRLHLDDFTFDLEAGNLFILPTELMTFYEADIETPWEYMWIGLSGTKIEGYLKRSVLMEDFFIKEVADSQFLRVFQELNQLTDDNEQLPLDLLMDSKVYEMLYYLVKEFPSRQLKLPSQQDIYFNQAIKYLFNYFNQPITVKDVYQELNLSRSYFHRIFSEKAGTSPQEFLMDLRMTKAGDLLIKSLNSITTISLSVGYRDALTFSKAFKHFYGLSPSAFREKNGTQKYERLLIKLPVDPKRASKFSVKNKPSL